MSILKLCIFIIKIFHLTRKYFLHIIILIKSHYNQCIRSKSIVITIKKQAYKNLYTFIIYSMK